MSYTRTDDRSSASAFRSSYFSRVLVQLRFSYLWRIVMVFLMTTTFVLGSWSTLVAQAQTTQTATTLTFPWVAAANSTANHKKPPQQPKITHAVQKTLSTQQPFDGLGDLPFYTYITYPIDDRVEMKVNVANGNLVVQTSDLHITGTGLDENLAGYYNSQAAIVPSDHGNAWNFNFGHDVRLDLTNPPAGITLHGPSGYSAFFAPNGTNVWTDAPGLNATLTYNTSTQYYTLTFHRTGEQWVFGPNSHLAEDEDKNGNQLADSYNSTHDLLSITDTQGRVTTFTHNNAYGSGNDPSGQITSFTDPSGRLIQYGYNERGNPTNSFTTLTDASGATTKFDYNGGDLTALTDPMSNVTSITYYNGDKVHTITDAMGNTITFTYNTTNGTTVVTDRDGNNTTYTWNVNEPRQDIVTNVQDALGHNQSNMYDANYNMMQYTDGLGDLSVFNFNPGTNTLGSALDGNKATSSFGYPTPGSQNQYYPMNQTDPQSNRTDYVYDSNGNLKSATNHATSTGLTYNYNPNGTIQNETDADGNVTSFGYDSVGNLTSVTPPAPLGGTTLKVEPLTSRVKMVTDGNNNVTTYTYDTLDRVRTITYNSNGTITYNYDTDGNLLSLVDNTGTTSFKYDTLNRLTKKTLPDGTIFSTGYDPTGNLTSFTDGSESIVYKYDIANRMFKLLDNGLATLYSYDNANRKTMIQYPNGTGMVIGYDKAGHETSNVGGTMDSQGNIQTTYDSFSYDYFKGTAATALLQSVTLLDPVKWPSGAMYTRNYTYDTQNRVTAVDVLNSSKIEVQKWTYGYDPNGNRTSYTQMSPAVSIGYTYTGGNELQTETQGSTTTNFTFDGNGNLTNETPGATLAYNGKEQTTTITTSSGSNTYTYSGPSQQDRVQINGATLDYSGLGVSQRTDTSGTTYLTCCSCGLLNNERIPNESRYYYLFDGLGSIVGMTSDSGNKVNNYDYDAYGVMLN